MTMVRTDRREAGYLLIEVLITMFILAYRSAGSRRFAGPCATG